MSKQSKQEIERRLQLIDQILQLKSYVCPLDQYNKGEKIHKKQIAFHKSTKRNRWVFGGNRTGKTECGAVECIWLARGIHPYKNNKESVSGWVVSLSTQVQRDVAQKKILHYLNPEWIEDIVMAQGRKDSPENGVIDLIKIKNVSGQISTIGFKSCDQGREKFQGTSLDFVWFDEEPPQDIYQECKMRVIDKCGEIFGTMTPLKGLTWVYSDIYLNEQNDPETWYIHMSWEDNPFLNEQEIQYLSSTMSKEELETRKYGNFTSYGGLVYANFDEQVNVIDPFTVPKEWYDMISIDPGLHNPLSCHWYAMDYDGNIYVIAEHYEAQKDIVHHAECIKNICVKLGWPKGFNGKYDALIDSAANQKTLASTKSVSELFYELGLNVNTHVNKDMFSGISRVKQYIKDANGHSKLFIFRTCTNMIREIKSYFWSDKDIPIKKDDHAMDELRYYIMTKPEPKPIKPQKSIIQKDKERLYRQLRRQPWR